MHTTESPGLQSCLLVVTTRELLAEEYYRARGYKDVDRAPKQSLYEIRRTGGMGREGEGYCPGYG